MKPENAQLITEAITQAVIKELGPDLHCDHNEKMYWPVVAMASAAAESAIDAAFENGNVFDQPSKNTSFPEAAGA